MVDMIFTILYIGIIVQIVLFIIAIKKKKQKIWMFLFFSQIIAYIASIIMTIYYGHYVSGFDGAAGYIVGFAVAVIYMVSFVGVAIVKIIMYEINCKKNKWVYANPIILITAMLFIVVGVALVSYDIVISWNELIKIDCEILYVPAFIVGGLILKYRMNKTNIVEKL